MTNLLIILLAPSVVFIVFRLAATRPLVYRILNWTGIGIIAVAVALILYAVVMRAVT